MSFRFPMTLGPALTKVRAMADSLTKEYLETVLGWKDLRVGHRRLQFGVYTPELSPSGEALLKKMMGAIGVESYEVVRDPALLQNFRHVLVFSSGAKALQGQASGSKLWFFQPLESYQEGSPQEVTQKKKEAWELLQAFKKEVLE